MSVMHQTARMELAVKTVHEFHDEDGNKLDAETLEGEWDRDNTLYWEVTTTTVSFEVSGREIIARFIHVIEEAEDQS